MAEISDGMKAHIQAKIAKLGGEALFCGKPLSDYSRDDLILIAHYALLHEKESRELWDSERNFYRDIAKIRKQTMTRSDKSLTR